MLPHIPPTLGLPLDARPGLTGRHCSILFFLSPLSPVARVGVVDGVLPLSAPGTSRCLAGRSSFCSFFSPSFSLSFSLFHPSLSSHSLSCCLCPASSPVWLFPFFLFSHISAFPCPPLSLCLSVVVPPLPSLLPAVSFGPLLVELLLPLMLPSAACHFCFS